MAKEGESVGAIFGLHKIMQGKSAKSVAMSDED